MNETLKFSLLFMVEKRKLDSLMSTVSVQSSTPSLNFMEATGMVIQTRKTRTIHPTIEDKDGNPMSVKDIRTRDHQRVQDLQDQGYNVEIFWEKDWKALLIHCPEIKVYLAQHRTHTHFKKYLTQDQIIQYIKDGHLFGFVECDIEVPDHLKEYFSEMTPILKNVDVCLDDVGEFMQNYAKKPHSIKDVARRLLIGSYFGKKIGLTTPLLKWYLEHGLVITRIYTTGEYIPNAAISSFKLLDVVSKEIAIKTIKH